jgi:tetratricopeptide (TPR) repeat protein
MKVFEFVLASVLAGTLAAAQEPPRATNLLALEAEEPDLSDTKADGGLLIREIVRQAILIAARDGLGLQTRDQVLGEIFPETATVLKVHTKALPGKSVAVRISRKDAVLLEKEIPLPAGGTIDYAALVHEAEALSRGAFIDVLKSAGFQGKTNPKGERGKVSDATEQALMTLTFTEQLRALRDLHAAARETGDAPVRMLAIVRGYAHLGNITECLFYTAHKVFKARALLYAERAGALWPLTRYSLWTRAYARAIAGFHGAALDDLAAAAKLPVENDPLKGAVPHWAAWIEAFCKNDDQALAAAEAPFNRGLLRFLAYVMYNGCRNSYMEVHKVRDALQANPECYDLYESQCNIGGIAILNEATDAAPAMLSSRIYARVADLPGIPEEVRRICDDRDPDVSEITTRPKLWKALAIAPDAGEPSWGVLSRLIRETTFAQVYRRVDLMRFKWAAQKATVLRYMNEARPLVEDHPYKAFFESFALDRSRQPKEWEALLSKLELVDIEMQEQDLFTATEGLNVPGKVFGKKAEALAWRHGDAISNDLQTEVLFQFGRDWNNMPARKQKALALLAVCPHSPTAVAELIASDWARYEAKAVELEEQYARHPQVLHEFGWKYKHLGKIADAERCFGKIAKTAPIQRDVTDLATIYKERGDMKRWREVFDDFLQAEDVAGLAHDSVRRQLATYFMSKKEWKTALPYAEAAGESWTQWGMDCARDCQEGLGNLEQAHEWQKRVSERYPKTEASWYFWVKKTGYGDEAAAEAHALKWIESLPGSTEGDWSVRGSIQLLRGNPKEAMAAFNEALKLDPHPFYALHTAIAAMEVGDAETRDRAIAAGRAYAPKDKKGPVYGAELVESLAAIVAAGADARIDLKAWDEMLAKQEAIGKINLPYFMGRILELKGRKEDAKPYYKRSADTDLQQSRRLNVALAADALRRLSK